MAIIITAMYTQCYVSTFPQRIGEMCNQQLKNLYCGTATSFWTTMILSNTSFGTTVKCKIQLTQGNLKIAIIRYTVTHVRIHTCDLYGNVSN